LQKATEGLVRKGSKEEESRKSEHNSGKRGNEERQKERPSSILEGKKKTFSF
jgi:hypothetical protein